MSYTAYVIAYVVIISSVNICTGSFEKDLTSITKGLEKVAAFYETHYNEVNLDSIFGLRAAEGI